jgi:hypothetical protein
MTARYLHSLMQRSHAIVRFLDCRFDRVVLGWIVLFSLACLPRLLMPETPVRGSGELAAHILPYALIALAPLAGLALATSSFPRGVVAGQPSIRLSVYGRWRPLGVLEARQSPQFGPGGFLVSLVLGLLLNVFVRSMEFLVAMPAIGSSAPDWGNRLFMLMAADVIVMNFFYTVCFVMALRSIPLFPRMLLVVWGIDIMMQLLIGREFARLHDIPHQVYEPLRDLLTGNITKVLISAFVWLPYLILSDRVNLTYRSRVRVG